MAGPLVDVKTITAGVGLDVDRTLNLGDVVLRFIVADPIQISNWRTLLVLSSGFNRISPSEETQGDGREVIIHVADLNGAVGTIIRTKGLHVDLDGEIYEVATVPKVAPNVAQVYKLTCKVRTMVNKYFDNTKR